MHSFCSIQEANFPTQTGDFFAFYCFLAQVCVLAITMYMPSDIYALVVVANNLSVSLLKSIHLCEQLYMKGPGATGKLHTP